MAEENKNQQEETETKESWTASGPKPKKFDLKAIKVPKNIFLFVFGGIVVIAVIFLVFMGKPKSDNEINSHSKPQPQTREQYKANQSKGKRLFDIITPKIKTRVKTTNPFTSSKVSETIKKVKSHFQGGIQVASVADINFKNQETPLVVYQASGNRSASRTVGKNLLNSILGQQNSLTSAANSISKLSASVPKMEANIQKQASAQALYRKHPNQGFLAATQVQKTNLQKVLTPVKPVSPYEVETGTIIPAVLMTRINSKLPGFIKAQVSSNVYSYNGKYLEIPKGSFLIGMYSSQITTGQERLLVAFKTLELPDGSEVDLMGMPGINARGIAGFHDLVSTHFWTEFGASLLLSFISIGSQAYGVGSGTMGASAYGSTPVTPVGVGEQAVGTTANNMSGNMLSKYANLAPTLIIRQGYRFNVFVSHNMVLKPY